MLKRLLQEPLMHFLVLAAMIFVVYGALDRSGAGKPDEIVVTGAKVEQLASLFARVWQRPPTPQELKGLIDDHVKEEMFVREAINLGLDKDDAVIRRRLRAKMEFFNDAATTFPAPADAELSEYLSANRGKFVIEPMFAFDQIFWSADRHGENVARDALAVLAALRTATSVDQGDLGDATMLPSRLDVTGKTSIGHLFGTEFAEALQKATPGQWSGPVKSEFGLHLVRINAHQPERVPELSEVRAAVEREWANDKQKALEDRRLAALLTRYRITIEQSPKAAPRSAANR